VRIHYSNSVVSSRSQPKSPEPELQPQGLVFKESAAMVPSEYTITYTTPPAFRGKIRRAAKRCLKEDKMIWLLFRWCSNNEAVDEAVKNMKLGVHTRVWSDRDLESVIIKLMPSGRHDVTVGTFAAEIVFKSATIPRHRVPHIHWFLLCQAAYS
jgi:hypothetical protein